MLSKLIGSVTLQHGPRAEPNTQILFWTARNGLYIISIISFVMSNDLRAMKRKEIYGSIAADCHNSLLTSYTTLRDCSLQFSRSMPEVFDLSCSSGGAFMIE